MMQRTWCQISHEETTKRNVRAYMLTSAAATVYKLGTDKGDFPLPPNVVCPVVCDQLTAKRFPLPVNGTLWFLLEE